MIRLCSIEGCGKPANTRGWCSSHYHRWQRYGDPLKGGRYIIPLTGKCDVDGCDLPDKKRGYCENHYRRFMAHGDPTAGVTSPNTLVPWLEAHKDYQGDDCLKWPFGGNGYGAVTYEGARHNAHRVMCLLAHGEPPAPNMDAAHNCGKGLEGCVNPRHLRWDTRSGNLADMEAHGTKNWGEQSGSAKLTEDQVRRIRSLRGILPQTEIAELVGTSKTNVWAIQTGRSWKHIKD